MPRPAPSRSGPRILAPLLACAALACGDGADAPAAGTAPTVVASIFPIGDLAGFMAGGDVHVEVLLPPRASPSTFEPTARQMARLSGAAGYLFIGGGMDRWAERLVSSGDRVVRLTEGMQLREGHAHEGDPGTGNPHIWLDPILVRDELLPRIEEVLVHAAPDHADGIRQRRLELADSLTALDAEIRAALANLRSRAIVSTHSAWVYFAERYGLVEVGSVYASPGREPSARQLAELVEEARKARVRAVFIEPQLGEVGARTLASELGVDVYLLDPQGGAEGRDDYLSLMRFNSHQLAKALGGGS